MNAVLDESMVMAATAGSLMRTAHGVAALIYADQATRAIELSDGMSAHAAANGIAMKLGNAYFLKGMAELRCGSLADAEADLTASLDIAIDGGAPFAEAIVRSLLAEVLLERGRLSEAVTMLGRLPANLDTPAVRYFRRMALSRLHRASGAREGAIAELTALGQEATSNGARNPRVCHGVPSSPICSRAGIPRELASSRTASCSTQNGSGCRAPSVWLSARVAPAK